MVNQQLNELNGRKSPLYKGVVFMLIVMESHHLPIVGINPGKGNDRASKLSFDDIGNSLEETVKQRAVFEEKGT